jgi:hypothetical protein
MNTTLRHRQNRMREAELSKEEEFFHPVIKNVACAISDWHSERDWFFKLIEPSVLLMLLQLS